MKLEKKPDKPINVQRTIQKAVDVILKEDQEHNINAILLFGSYADGTAIWRSDIDICVVFKKMPTEKEAFMFRVKVMGVLPDIVDLQVFNVLPQKIKKTIADNHKVLFHSPTFDEMSFIRVNQELFYELKQKIATLEIST
ncbi:TPA: nucleotidyltransferase domain-containing protein [Candidatus Woesearchaeota archaeon]|nr:nucleotidyltransferase domain-containing protein [Candidatus Woesearchaeota archaeon]